MAYIFKSIWCYCYNHFFKRNIFNNYLFHHLNDFDEKGKHGGKTSEELKAEEK